MNPKQTLAFLLPLLVAAGAGCGAVQVPEPGHPYAVPYERLSDDQRARARKVMDAPTCMVELERTAVRSTPGVYLFLLEELPFASSVLRELGQATYQVTRDGQGAYILQDGAGLKIRAELILREDCRWIYYTYGYYDLGLVRAYGRSIIIVRYEPDGEFLQTEARVYAKVENGLLEAGALALRPGVENMIREKSFVFVRAAQKVAEMTANNARSLHEAVAGSAQVDPSLLEEFRRRFVR